MLYKVFIDDSGAKQYREPYSREFIDNPPDYEQYPDFWRNNYFVLCGVRVKQEDMSQVNREINTLKKEYFGTHKVEIKSDWLRNPHKRKKHYLESFKEHITTERLNEFGEKYIDLITRHHKKLKLFAVVFDKRCYGDAKRQTAEGAPLLKTTQVLFERIQYVGGYNLVIFDQMESSLRLTSGEHHRILQVFQSNEGMETIHVERYDKIADIKFMRSARENFLQLADICAYNVFRQFVEHGRDWIGASQEEDGKHKMGKYPYFYRIRCNFFCHPTAGQVRGYGLTCIPDSEKINWNLRQDCPA